MMIDLHTYVWTTPDQLGRESADRLRRQLSDRWNLLDASPAAHERAMSCVNAAAVLGFRSDRLGACIPNEYVAEFVAKDPRRRVGIAGIDPMAADALEHVEQAVNLGLVGITVSPATQGFHPSHSAAMRVYERSADLGLPLLVTTNHPLSPSTVMEFGRPMHWDEVARSLPTWPIVITGLGYPWIDETLVLLAKHDNLYADVAGVTSRPWQLYNVLLNALSFGVMDKILFGSGFPFESPAKAIETLYMVNSFSHGTQLPSIPRALIRRIVERNSFDCLGIECEAGASIAIETPGAAGLVSRTSHAGRIGEGLNDDEDLL
jgi:hypothetical protein